MANDEARIMDFFQEIKNCSLVSISYEYDPTDALKMPQLIALSKDEVY